MCACERETAGGKRKKQPRIYFLLTSEVPGGYDIDFTLELLAIDEVSDL